MVYWLCGHDGCQVAINGDVVIDDAKSGVSGGGTSQNQHPVCGKLQQLFTIYSIYSHRHLPEMERLISWWHQTPPLILVRIFCRCAWHFGEYLCTLAGTVDQTALRAL